MKMNRTQYLEYIKDKGGRSPLGRNCLWAFVVGGTICTIGQLIRQGYMRLGLDETSVAAATSITLIFLGVLFTGLDLYDRLARYAGAGTIVPITGFANSIAAPAMEFRSEGLITGTGARMFVVAGPVLVYGISASILYGIILCVFHLA